MTAVNLIFNACDGMVGGVGGMVCGVGGMVSEVN